MDINDLTIINETSNTWSHIQPFIKFSTSFVSFGKLFLKKKPDELKKIQAEELGKVATEMLRSGEIGYVDFVKFNNIMEIAKKADEIRASKVSAENIENEAPETKIGLDWFLRFCEYASNISDEQMQNLWAGIWSGEAERPGSFSLRTLLSLSTLSKHEAEAFKRIASYSMHTGGVNFIYRDAKLSRKYSLDEDLFTMYDCGLLAESSEAVLIATAINKSISLYTANIVWVNNCDAPTEYSFPITRFTPVGNELLKLVTFSRNEDYVIDCFKKIKQKNPGIKLTAHSIIQTFDDGDIEWEEEDLLQSK